VWLEDLLLPLPLLLVQWHRLQLLLQEAAWLVGVQVLL
jgi:hypothetical protein